MIKSIRRQAVTTTGFTALALLAISAVAGAQVRPSDIQAQQRQQLSPPNPASPRVLVTPFASASAADSRVATDLSQELRDVIENLIDPKVLWVIPRQLINHNLSNAGFKPDSALAPTDVVALGRVLSANETIDGVLTRGADGGLQFRGKFYFNNKLEVVEHFAPVTGRNAQAVARSFGTQYRDMRKQLDGYKKCELALANSKWDSAAVYARSVIAAYGNSSMGRLCLLSAFAYDTTVAPDSVLRVGLEILQRDSANMIALGNVRDAYVKKNDGAKAAEFAFKIFNLDQSNTAAATSLINLLVNSGSPERALPVIEQLIAADPGNSEAYLSKLNVQLLMGSYKESFETAELLMRINPDAATLEFFKRMAGASQADSNQAKMLEWLARGTQKFADDAELQLSYASELNKAGQLQQAVEAARRAVQVKPDIPGGLLTVVVLYSNLNDADSAIVYGRKALAVADADSATIGAALLKTLSPLNTKASSSNEREDWEELYRAASQIDSLAPSTGSKFFVGFSAANVGFQSLQEAAEAANATPPKTAVACAQAAITSEMFEIATAFIRQGAQFNMEGTTAVFTNITQYNTVPAQISTALKCPAR